MAPPQLFICNSNAAETSAKQCFFKEVFLRNDCSSGLVLANLNEKLCQCEFKAQVSVELQLKVSLVVQTHWTWVCVC